MSEIIRKPEEETNVTYVTCSKCGGTVMEGVQHLLDKEGKKELAELVTEGHTVQTIPLLEYRKLENEWCNTKCN